MVISFLTFLDNSRIPTNLGRLALFDVKVLSEHKKIPNRARASFCKYADRKLVFFYVCTKLIARLSFDVLGFEHLATLHV